jgi:hypothetical protein
LPSNLLFDQLLILDNFRAEGYERVPYAAVAIRDWRAKESDYTVLATSVSATRNFASEE